MRSVTQRNAARAIITAFVVAAATGIGARAGFAVQQDANDRGFTLAQVLSSPFPSSLVASRTGSRIAWVFDSEGVKSIWIAEGPEFDARTLIDFEVDDGQAVSIVGFSYDGSHLVYTRGDEYNPTHDAAGAPDTTLYSIPWDGGEPIEIADAGGAVLSPVSNTLVFTRGGDLWRGSITGDGEPEKALSVRGRISQVRFAPTDERLIMRVSRSSTNERYSYIALFELGAPGFRYLDASIYQDGSPAWSTDGSQVAFIRRLTQGGQGGLNAREYPVPDPREIRVVDVESGEITGAMRQPEEGSYGQAEVEWTSDNALIFASERDGWRRLYSMRASGGRVRPVSPENAEVEEFAVVRDGSVFFTTNAGDIDRRHLWAFDGRRPSQITAGDGIEWSPVPTGDGSAVAHFGSDAAYPAHVFVRPLVDAGRESIRLAPDALHADFPTLQMVTPEQVILRAPDGVAVHCQLFRPSDEFDGPRPAVMFFHGGPIRQMLLGWHYRQYYHRAYAINQYLASRGYYVLSVNYRLGVGYGRDFRDVPDGGPRGASEYQDVLAGAAYLRSLDEVDPQRIGLWGGSYGGYLTAMGLARNSDLFAAGVDLHGVHDWNQWQAWSQEADLDKQHTALSASPIDDIHTWRSPVLLVHGDDDRNVPFSETMRLVRELKDRGVDHELMVLPDEPHSFLRHESWVRVAEATADFFDRKLRDKATRSAPIATGSARYEFDLDGTNLEVFTYKPSNYNGSRMIFVMHGVLRNADEYRDHAMAMGDRFGALIVTPRFDAERFPTRAYQYGNVMNGDGEANDPSAWTYAYLPKLASFFRDMEDKPDLPYSVIGHSAGGQFVARMSAFFDPGAERLVAANPGSQLFPTRDMEFGYGLGGLPRELSDDEAIQRYLAKPLTIYLGTADNGPDNYFDNSAAANAQGPGRWQRGRACFEFAKRLAEERGWTFNWRLVEAEGIGHDHEQMFNHPAAERALFGDG